jgi:hypothetical protein
MFSMFLVASENENDNGIVLPIPHGAKKLGRIPFLPAQMQKRSYSNPRASKNMKASPGQIAYREEARRAAAPRSRQRKSRKRGEL